MKDNFEQQLKKMQNVKLSADEKRDLKQVIDAHVRVGDVRSGQTNRQYEYKRSSFVLSILTKQKYYMTGLAIGLMLLVGGGTSFAANDALPGDFLYPVKTEVNERLEGAFALSAESEAEFESELAERRLTEATKLAAKGELNADTRAQVEQRFDMHVQKALARAKSLSDEAKADIATRVQSRIESALSAHADVLAQAHGQTEAGIAAANASPEGSAESAVMARADAHADVNAFVENIRARIGDAVEARVSAESRLSTEGEVNIENAALRMQAAAEKKIDAVVRILESDTVEAEVSAKVKPHVDEANRLLVAGQADIESGEVRAGYRHFVEAFQLANRIHVFLKAHINSGFRLANINIFTHGGGEDGSSATMMIRAEEGTTTNNEKDSSTEVRGEGEMTACTMEAKQCPDGSYVGRSGPNCTFDPCPGEEDREENVENMDREQYQQEGDRLESDRGRSVEIETRSEMRGEVEVGSDGAEAEANTRTLIRFGI